MRSIKDDSLPTLPPCRRGLSFVRALGRSRRRFTRNARDRSACRAPRSGNINLPHNDPQIALQIIVGALAWAPVTILVACENTRCPDHAIPIPKSTAWQVGQTDLSKGNTRNLLTWRIQQPMPHFQSWNRHSCVANSSTGWRSRVSPSRIASHFASRILLIGLDVRALYHRAIASDLTADHLCKPFIGSGFSTELSQSH